MKSGNRTRLFLSYLVKTVAGTLLTLFTISAIAASEAPADASVYIVSPKNGDVVTSPVLVQFGLTGMGVAPAGVDKANTGHHHLLIDVDTLPDMSKPVPSDKNHRHFGGGQTEVSVELEPGTHTLQLLLGDYSHVPHSKPVVSEKITITVK
ncbi:DUF4399 domain-containing protein [Aestuariirhabdus sp. Z084]|uniref:DUF4399 domain-containing protein n=1 Tax=Aestuariirhabdus haliotis TaxID=2918751 RepID=UPI00201B35EB|nr:DUF4399 domain-containing protein [Aestuariirhabdus haliotis]MCL6416528.1 DUF4399 domain-containing protein [Aestuariirhabdus haliotis]MCL6420518.1 DUF4399 domain-containing protein [Aestuariirhabdus haliotis]